MRKMQSFEQKMQKVVGNCQIPFDIHRPFEEVLRRLFIRMSQEEAKYGRLRVESIQFRTIR